MARGEHGDHHLCGLDAEALASQRASTLQRALPCGDYGLLVDGQLVASMERKSLADLVTSQTRGLHYQVADLAALRRMAVAAVVVEDRYSQLFQLDRVRPRRGRRRAGRMQIRWLNVAIVLCETRPLAEEWTYRFLAAAHAGKQLNTLHCNTSRSSGSTSPNSIRQPRRRNRAPPRSALGHAPPAHRYPTAAASGPTSGRCGATPTTRTDRPRWHPRTTLAHQAGPTSPGSHQPTCASNPGRLTLDVVEGRSSGFSLKAPEGAVSDSHAAACREVFTGIRLVPWEQLIPTSAQSGASLSRAGNRGVLRRNPPHSGRRRGCEGETWLLPAKRRGARRSYVVANPAGYVGGRWIRDAPRTNRKPTVR